MIATLQNQPGPWTFPFITEYWDGNSGITITGQGVSSWVPVKGTNSFTQGTDGARPTYSGGVLTLNGTDEFLQATFDAPSASTVFLAVNQITWTGNDTIWSSTGGATEDDWNIFQNSATPQIALFAGSTAASNGGLAVGTFGILAATFNVASSALQMNLGTPTTGNPGAVTGTGVSIGSNGAGTSNFANISLKGAGYSDSALTAGQIEQMVWSMAARYGITF